MSSKRETPSMLHHPYRTAAERTKERKPMKWPSESRLARATAGAMVATLPLSGHGLIWLDKNGHQGAAAGFLLALSIFFYWVWCWVGDTKRSP
jgi:hypothetical protein